MRTRPVLGDPYDSHMTAHTFQVVIDARDPHAQADWWAETLGWEVEPQDEGFIRSMIDQGFATEAETTQHHGRLVWATGAAINGPEGTGLPRVLFQWVPEAKTVKKPGAPRRARRRRHCSAARVAARTWGRARRRGPSGSARLGGVPRPRGQRVLRLTCPAGRSTGRPCGGNAATRS